MTNNNIYTVTFKNNASIIVFQPTIEDAIREARSHKENCTYDECGVDGVSDIESIRLDDDSGERTPGIDF